MAHIRKLPSGKWQANVRLPDDAGRRSRTFTRRADAHHWMTETEAIVRRLAEPPELSLSWSTAGLHIDIPEDLLTMDAAMRIERAITEILGEG